MQLVFVDESGDQKFKDYFGLCVGVVHSAHYKNVKTGFHRILEEAGWNKGVEFKGSHLFSASKGDPAISVEKRIEIAGAALDLNKSDVNARLRFHYYRKRDCKDHKNEYLTRLPDVLRKALPPAKKGVGKDLVHVSCDFRQDISPAEVQAAVAETIADRGYTLLEEVTMSRSGFHTVGILYADIVGYLCGRIDVISHDIELFDDIPQEHVENNGKLKKLKSSTDLIGRVKHLETYELK